MRRSLSRAPVTQIEISTSQMVMAQKLISIAWNVHDGRRKAEVGVPGRTKLTNRTLMRVSSLPDCSIFRVRWHSSVTGLSPMTRFR